MKSWGSRVATAVGIVGVCVAVWAADNPKTSGPPSLTLSEALNIACDYVQTNKIDVSQYFIASVSLSGSEHKDYWDVIWQGTNRNIKGASILVRVDMDKNIQYGKSAVSP